jgi:hypothetical protein
LDARQGEALKKQPVGKLVYATVQDFVAFLALRKF